MKSCARKYLAYLAFGAVLQFPHTSQAIAFAGLLNGASIENRKSGDDNDTTQVQLARVYNNQNLKDYVVSEKYDGIRAIWKNQQLRTRRGNTIHAPLWFTQGLPDVWLDGELWYQRDKFEYVASTVSKDKPIDSEWRNIRYMVFDMPDYHHPFIERYHKYSRLIKSLALPHVAAVEQFEVESNKALYNMLEDFTQKKAEGLMLQKKNAMFADGRSGNLYKLKQFMDAEAHVIQHKQGKGKYSEVLGALLVEYRGANGATVQFKIGSGFSDNERRNPPQVGSIITFKYHGLSKNGVPRFASFVRVREQP